MNKKNISLRKYGFTLVELIFVSVIIALIMPEMFSLYNFIIKSNREIIARQQAIQQGYEFFERLNILMEDYTIDYEEYYNRQMVGCSYYEDDFGQGTQFKRNTGLSGYCTDFTAYGNENNYLSSPITKKYHSIYYCSTEKQVFGNDTTTKVIKGSNCGVSNKGKQSYGQYAALFKDVKGGVGEVVGTNDDVELGDFFARTRDSSITMDAIGDSNNIKEIYLISHDGKNRLYFRRILDKFELDDDGNMEYKQYKIQMMRLRGFDAGRRHNFNDSSSANKGLYDGVIDTWACDTSMGFKPNTQNHSNCSNPNSPGNSVCGAYSDYYLPQDENDCWVDLTHGTTDLFAWNISISPIGNPDLYRAEPEKQINPYMKILIINKIYFPSIVGNHRRMANTIDEFVVPLETTINMKDFYKENR